MSEEHCDDWKDMKRSAGILQIQRADTEMLSGQIDGDTAEESLDNMGTTDG